MKKLLIFCLLSILSLNFMSLVNADVGPKPETRVEIIGLDQDYYFDLLFPIDAYKVKVLTDEEMNAAIENDYYREDYPDVLNGYRDEDGYASYTLYRGIPHHIGQVSDHLYSWGFFNPPDKFKIVLILESSDIIIVSDIIHKTLYYAEFTFDLSHDDLLEQDFYQGVERYLVENAVYEYIPWTKMIIQFVLAVILTLILEVFVLFMFGYKKKSSYIFVFYINLITQVLFHSGLIYFSLRGAFFGFVASFIIGEVLVFGIEMYLYRKYLKEKPINIASLYGFVANLVSMVLGTLILGYTIGFI